MSRWFRLDDDVINDPKILLLPEALRWIWVAFLCIASKHDGRIPKIEIVALMLRVKATKAAEYLTTLTKAGLIDEDETGFAPHNWARRQFKSDVSTERVKRFRKQERNVSETPPHTQTEAQTEKKETEPVGSGAEAPPDPSEPERQFFKRVREVLGKSAGGQGTKLLRAAGGNVALARSKIELAATKDNASEFIAKVITAAGTGPPAKPLTQHQIERQESREILNDLQKFIDDSSGRGGDADLGLLRFDPGDGQKSVHRGPGRDLVDLSARRGREGG